MQSIKKKTYKGFFWSFIESASSQIVGFICTIILARMLFPSDFGLIGMTVIITALAQALVDSGFSQALIRKQNCTEIEYNTVFYSNILIGFFLYLFIFLISPFIASFFDRPELVIIIRVISIVIPINSFSLIQKTILTKDLNFKSQSYVTLLGVSIAFTSAVLLANAGYGVWSLVFRGLIQQLVIAFMLWKFSKWRPSLFFSFKSVKDLFNFGSKLMIIASISVIFRNILNVLIGKIYNANTLGLYSNADQMSGLPSGTITTMYNKVAYPVLVTMQNDNNQLKTTLKKINQPLILFSFTLMLFMIAISDSIIPLLLGNKWIMIVPYFKILCIGYMAPILHTYNQIILNVKGKSNYFLYTEILKYILFIPVLLVGIKFGIYGFLIGFSIHYWVGFLVNAIYSKSLIDYSILEQVIDFIKPLLFALIVFFATYYIQKPIENISILLRLIIQIISGSLTVIFLLRFKIFFSISDYITTFKKLILKKQ